jgi:hypothetical protein
MRDGAFVDETRLSSGERGAGRASGALGALAGLVD